MTPHIPQRTKLRHREIRGPAAAHLRAHRAHHQRYGLHDRGSAALAADRLITSIIEQFHNLIVPHAWIIVNRSAALFRADAKLGARGTSSLATVLFVGLCGGVAAT